MCARKEKKVSNLGQTRDGTQLALRANHEKHTSVCQSFIKDCALLTKVTPDSAHHDLACNARSVKAVHRAVQCPYTENCLSLVYCDVSWFVL